ncbi:MAG TPA: energy transducer TonB [Rhizomicrobium sp.]|nr:energy transducer TonB [Rhizomicrobium sp.]
MRRQFALAVLAALAAPSAQALADASPQSAGATSCVRNYPGAALRAGIEGTTMLAFTVTEQGTVTDVSVTKSSGNADLDQAALRCIAERHFNTARAVLPDAGTAKDVMIDWRNDLVPVR